MVKNLSRIWPSVTVPGLLAPINQDVDFRKYFGDITSYGEVGVDAVYYPTLEKISGMTTVFQQWNDNLPQVDIENGQLEAKYYTIGTSVQYTDEQAGKFSKIYSGVSLDQVLDDLSKMAINQKWHFASLYGFVPEDNDGLVNNGINVNLPADSAGADTMTGYIPAELMSFIASQIREAMNVSFGTLKPAVIAGSTRAINYIRSTVVALNQYQMQGGGVDSIAGTLGRIVGDWLGVGRVEFIADDLLMDQTGGNADKILIIAPGLGTQDEVPEQYSQYLLDDMPLNRMNTTMDKMSNGLITTVNPVINRTVRRNKTLKTTAGIVLRSQAVRVISFNYA